MRSVFRAEGLHKSFGSLVVTNDVHLDLPHGRRHALIGPNGAGKTTLFNLITGEIAADAGRVILDGQDISHFSPDGRARAGLARSFQRNNLFADLTVRENLTIACALQQRLGHVAWRSLAREGGLRRDAEESAARLGIEDEFDTLVRHLSYGTQRQLEIGLALVMRPKLLLLDEPTAGMSPEETAAMLALIGGLPEDLTVLIIEHDMDVVFGVAERITVLDYGSVLLEGDGETVRGSKAVRSRYLGTGDGGHA
jgi:branched-chain amino acid transport system ATP-binding protein